MHRHLLDGLDQLKSDIESHNILRECDFFERFEALFQGELRHNRCESDSTFDWMQLTLEHLSLIDGVTGFHQREEEQDYQKVLEDNLDAEQVFGDLRDGRRGHRVYLFNGEDTCYDVVGDLHADPESLMEIVRRTSFVQKAISGEGNRLIFMGDYVDRGKAHLSLLARLLALKYCFSDRIFLLRGNHDGGVYVRPKQAELPYRKPEGSPDEDYFPTYLIKLSVFHPETEPLLKAYLSFFETLGQYALIQTQKVITMVVHGGIPRPLPTEEGYFTYLENLAMLSDAEHMDPFGRKMTQNLMWSDPYSGEEDLREGMGRYYFTESQFMDFIETIGVHQMLRGHQWMDAGYREHFGSRLYTIFSSGQWPDQAENPLTAYPTVYAKWARLTAEGVVEIRPLF